MNTKTKNAADEICGLCRIIEEPEKKMGKKGGEK